MCVSVSVCVYMWLCVCVRVCVHACMRACVCACMCSLKKKTNWSEILQPQVHVWFLFKRDESDTFYFVIEKQSTKWLNKIYHHSQSSKTLCALCTHTVLMFLSFHESITIGLCTRDRQMVIQIWGKMNFSPPALFKNAQCEACTQPKLFTRNYITCKYYIVLDHSHSR